MRRRDKSEDDGSAGRSGGVGDGDGVAGVGCSLYNSYGLHSYGLYRYGVYSHGLYNTYGMYDSYGVYSVFDLVGCSRMADASRGPFVGKRRVGKAVAEWK